ncbi:MAG: DNA methylase [Oscillospiraceae bacterium]|nr:DNA methylase [Oscillospiraceae bacterium]
MREPTYICIDLKSYYASVECVARGLDPLTARLLVADETRSDNTIVLAVSPALKALGVRSRPRLFEAKQAIRLAEAQQHRKIDFIIAPPRMAEYERVSAAIYAIYLKYVAVEDIHVYSIDEVFIDVTRYLRLYAKAAAQAGMAPAHYMAVTMIRNVLKTTGITATVGIGPNLYLAKVGMDIVAKKAPPDRDGVRVAELNEEMYKRLLWPVRPLTAFWQMGEGKTRRLAKYGILTMGDIARVSLADEEFLYRQFGIDAEIMIDHAWGIEPCTIADIKAYRPKAHSLSVGQVLPRPYAYDEARLVFAEMVEQLAMDLVNKGLATSCLTFWVSFDPVSLEKCRYDGPVAIDYYGRLHPRHTGGTVRLRTRTSSARVLRGALLVAFESHVDHQLYVRRLGVAANDTHNDCLQLDMFTDYEALENDEKVQRVILSIRRKYGSNAILKGMNYLEGATARERNTQIGGHRA